MKNLAPSPLVNPWRGVSSLDRVRLLSSQKILEKLLRSTVGYKPLNL
jgi:hypothetical protein